MQSLRNEINVVRNSLMNYAILCLLIITLPATIFSILHLISKGHLPDYGISIIETLFILSVILIICNFLMLIYFHKYLLFYIFNIQPQSILKNKIMSLTILVIILYYFNSFERLTPKLI